jgi:hypothetical protein
MKNFLITYKKEKNAWLKEHRKICFEDILVCIDENLILGNLEHPNSRKYPNQKILVVKLNSYAWAVPYEINNKKIELKTAFPSRKLTKLYLKGDDD